MQVVGRRYNVTRRASAANATKMARVRRRRRDDSEGDDEGKRVFGECDGDSEESTHQPAVAGGGEDGQGGGLQ